MPCTGGVGRMRRVWETRSPCAPAKQMGSRQCHTARAAQSCWVLGAWGKQRKCCSQTAAPPRAKPSSPLLSGTPCSSPLSFSSHHFCCFYASEAVNKQETRGPLVHRFSPVFVFLPAPKACLPWVSPGSNSDISCPCPQPLLTHAGWADVC